MKYQLNIFTRCIILLLVLAGSAFADDSEQSPSSLRTCTVQEVLDSGGYSYIRCEEGPQEIWVATMQTKLDIGTQISFQDTPPMVNFTSKGLNRTFPQVRFVPGISRSGEIRPEESPGGQTPPKGHSGVYTGTDDKGAVIFTDDPDKAPHGATRVR